MENLKLAGQRPKINLYGLPQTANRVAGAVLAAQPHLAKQLIANPKIGIKLD